MEYLHVNVETTGLEFFWNLALNQGWHMRRIDALPLPHLALCLTEPLAVSPLRCR